MSLEKEEIKYAVYSKNGTRILKDGHAMFSADIVKDLNRKSYLEEQTEKLSTELEQTKEKLKRCEEFLRDINLNHALVYRVEQFLSQLKDNG